jgi:hypothetical protein
MKKPLIGLVFFIAVAFMHGTSYGESNKEYKNKFMLMLDHAVHVNDYVRQRLGDKSLALYAHGMAETNASAAERMTPPTKYAMLHPHFLLVLENIERSFYFAHKGDLAHYRHHQKMVRKELQLLEALADRARVDLYIWGQRR